MAKETDKSTVTLQGDAFGEVRIADDVVANIAALAAVEVDGVAATAGNITKELMNKVGMKTIGKGVRVEVIESAVSVDIALIMEYGYNIPTTCKSVQERIKAAIENMTGLEVSDVNIRIAGINMEKQDR
ncbi:MAG: Asp23/Gls24 family envelope stress response protein [bacterium]|nr:Asp23/Gls24 family envelope stress response protein [bacterium]